MIEIIYDKGQEQGMNGSSSSSSSSGSGNRPAGFRLPKNFRQMGAPSGSRRIYMEDYVVTYLNQLSRPGNIYSRGAILLGEYRKSDAGEVIFISGALEAQNLELDLDETVFTNETWSDIYENVKRYFPNLEVVGWFLSRMGFSTDVNDKIEKTHLDNFSGRDKVLYIIDALEGEDAFYLYEMGALRKQPGYYIYYERNQAMQNYMIDQHQDEEDQQETMILKKDEALIQNYRSMIQAKKKKNASKNNQLMYVASSFLTLAVLALGITVLNNYDRMKAIEISLNRLNLTNEESAGEDILNENTENPVTTVVSVGANVEPTTESTQTSEADAQELQEAASTTTATTTTTTETVTEATTETINNVEEPNSAITVNANSPAYYTVKAGDTLTSISYAMYQSTQYVHNIVEANNMENEDEIYIGQKIIIPTIN